MKRLKDLNEFVVHLIVLIHLCIVGIFTIKVALDLLWR